jgi:hypothetical protein
MKIYSSKSSLMVKLITIGLSFAMILLVLTLFFSQQKYGLLGGVILGLIIVGSLFYFFANSLDKVFVENGEIILKRNIGAIKIKASEIKSAENLRNSNLTMTFGSMGFFGFIGSTMDNSESLVKDRSKMIRIKTVNKDYTISCENPVELVEEIRTLQ